MLFLQANTYRLKEKGFSSWSGIIRFACHEPFLHLICTYYWTLSSTYFLFLHLETVSAVVILFVSFCVSDNTNAAAMAAISSSVLSERSSFSGEKYFAAKCVSNFPL